MPLRVVLLRPVRALPHGARRDRLQAASATERGKDQIKAKLHLMFLVFHETLCKRLRVKLPKEFMHTIY